MWIKNQIEFSDMRHWLYCVIVPKRWNLELNAPSFVHIYVLMRTYLCFYYDCFIWLQRWIDAGFFFFFFCFYDDDMFSVQQDTMLICKRLPIVSRGINSESLAGPQIASFSLSWNLKFVCSDWQSRIKLLD